MKEIKQLVVMLNDILMLCLFFILGFAGYLGWGALGAICGVTIGVALSGWWAAISSIVQSNNENTKLLQKILKGLDE